MLDAGNYIASPIGGTFGKSKDKGSLFIAIQFQLKDRPERIWYQGYMTGGALQYTLKNIVIAGYDESQEVPADEEGNAKFGPEQFLDPNKEVELVVQHEDYENRDGEVKTRARVAFINEVGGGFKFQGLNVEETASELASINFQAEMMALREKMGMGAAPAPQPATKPAHAPRVAPGPQAKPVASKPAATAARPPMSAQTQRFTKPAPKKYNTPQPPPFDADEEVPF